MFFMANMTISSKLAVAVAAIVMVILVVGGVTHRKVAVIEKSNSWTAHTYEVLSGIQNIMAAIVDQETGVRGYLVSGDDRFLEPYRAGRGAYEAAFANVKFLTLDNRPQQERLDRLSVLASRWDEVVAQREISLMSQVSTQEQARRMEASGVGKQSIDDIRALISEISMVERNLLATRVADQQRAIRMANLTLVIGATASLVFAVIAGYLLKLGVARQITNMTSVMQRLARGETTVDVPGVGRRDEIGKMAETIVVFKKNSIDKKCLEVLLMRIL